MALARTLLPEGGAIVAPIITKVGGKILIVAAGDGGPIITVLELPGLTSERLDRLLRGAGKDPAVGGWFGAYNIQYLPSEQQASRIGEWRAAIEGIGPTLWTLFAARLDAELQRLGVGRAAGWSGYRPVPSASCRWASLGILPAVGSSLMLTRLHMCRVSSIAGSAAIQLAQAPDISLAAAVNPTGNIPKLSLPFAEIEGVLVAAHFTGRPMISLDKSNATPDAVLAALKGKSYWHFSSHGFFDWKNPRSAGLRMKDGAPLTVEALLETEDRLGRPRLVVMSACETGLYDISRKPDEFVGLPATFMQLGATGVLSTLWQVDDLATTLLMAKFYDLHLDQKLSPATALRQAQAWLRTASKAELIGFGKAAAARAKLNSSKLANLEASLKSRRRSGTRGSFWNILQDFGTNAQQQFQSHPSLTPTIGVEFVYTRL